MNYHKLYEIPGPSTSSISGTLLDYPGGELTLRFDYDRDGVVYRSGLRFLKVRAQRHRAEIHCPAEHVKVAYDSLVEISGSVWVQELVSSTVADLRDSWVMNHYLLFIDGSGSYEVIAESWEELPEEKGSWTAASGR